MRTAGCHNGCDTTAYVVRSWGWITRAGKAVAQHKLGILLGCSLGDGEALVLLRWLGAYINW